MKRYGKYIYTSLCIVLCGVFVALSIRASASVAAMAENSFGDKDTPTVIIDAGHGAEDGGAVSSGGLLEKDINLSIALTLEKLFRQSGFDVIMTRTDDAALYDATAATIREKKVADIHKRTEIVNSDKNNILISIHQNKFDDSVCKGAQIFFSSNNIQSEALAENVRSAVVGLIQNDNTRKCKKATSSIYILHHAEVPAIMVECGFLSNHEEEKLLSTEEYRNSMAFAVYSGFLEFYYNNY
ncbi:MAG: N-acetylmuramoyl-L-alanine amidase [Ruminococcus sp.]